MVLLIVGGARGRGFDIIIIMGEVCTLVLFILSAALTDSETAADLTKPLLHKCHSTVHTHTHAPSGDHHHKLWRVIESSIDIALRREREQERDKHGNNTRTQKLSLGG